MERRTAVKKLEIIDSKENREEEKMFCKLWLKPELLTAQQIRDTIRELTL